MTQFNSLDSLLFISLPQNFNAPETSFKIDVGIPLPVQRSSIPEDEDEAFDLASLSWEMILAGILTVLAYDTNNTHTNYYRSLLLALRPNIKQELTEAAILKAHNEDYEIAEEIFAALRGLDPEDMVTTLNSALFFDERASSYAKSGLFEDAEAYDDSAHRFYKIAMAAEPAIPDAFFNAGFFYLKQKNYLRAKDTFQTYLTLTAKQNQQDFSENEQYKRERAEEIVQDISARNLDDELFKSAYDFISMGQEEKGLEQIKLFLTSNPKVWNGWFMLGWALRRLERWEDGKNAFLHSISCGGENTDTCNELAICCMELGDYKNAEKQLIKALSMESENTKVMSNLGFLYLKQGKVQQARKYFEIVLEFDPDDVIAKKTLENL